MITFQSQWAAVCEIFHAHFVPRKNFHYILGDGIAIKILYAEREQKKKKKNSRRVCCSILVNKSSLTLSWKLFINKIAVSDDRAQRVQETDVLILDIYINKYQPTY